VMDALTEKQALYMEDLNFDTHDLNHLVLPADYAAVWELIRDEFLGIETKQWWDLHTFRFANAAHAQGQRTVTRYYEEVFTKMERMEAACALWPKLPTAGMAGPFGPALTASQFFANTDPHLRAEVLHHNVYPELVNPANMSGWDQS
jgi:hypothetical protein